MLLLYLLLIEISNHKIFWLISPKIGLLYAILVLLSNLLQENPIWPISALDATELLN